jgi:hypothetical protein
MPNLKKAAVDAVIEKLELEKQDINYKLRKNKGQFKELIDEQTCLKRQLVVLQDLIRGLTNK